VGSVSVFLFILAQAYEPKLTDPKYGHRGHTTKEPAYPPEIEVAVVYIGDEQTRAATQQSSHNRLGLGYTGTPLRATFWTSRIPSRNNFPATRTWKEV
jgi:hypothetical protein